MHFAAQERRAGALGRTGSDVGLARLVSGVEQVGWRGRKWGGSGVGRLRKSKMGRSGNCGQSAARSRRSDLSEVTREQKRRNAWERLRRARETSDEDEGKAGAARTAQLQRGWRWAGRAQQCRLFIDAQ